MTVIGLLLLTLGTGAQAWTNLTEYQDLFSTVPEATRRAVREQFTDWHLPRRWYLSLGTLSFARILIAGANALRHLLLALKQTPQKMIEIRHASGNDAARIVQLARQAAIWTVLMLGSMFVMAGAIIQLVHAYA